MHTRPLAIRVPSVVVFLFCFFVCGLSTPAQRPGGGTATQAPPQRPGFSPLPTPTDVVVSVREASGLPLTQFALVKLMSQDGLRLTATTQENSTATFSRVLGGEYDIEVTCTGYQPATEHASVYAGGTSYNVYIICTWKASPWQAAASPVK